MPTEQYKISGKYFDVNQPYAEGHVLTGAEANALNQTYAENVRNNFSKRVSAWEEAGTFDQEAAQAALNDYMEEYTFGSRVSSGGGRVTDPVEAEALRLAKEQVRGKIRAKGYSLKDYPAAQVTELAKQLMAKNPSIRTQAEAIVAAAKEVSVDDDIDIPVGEAPAAEAETTAEAAPSRGRKAAAE